MKTTATSANTLSSTGTILRYAPLWLLAAGMAGCAPAYVAPPIEAAPRYDPPLQAMPLTPAPRPRPVDVPPAVSPAYVSPQPIPVDDFQRIEAEPLPEQPTRTLKPSQPSVTFIPDKRVSKPVTPRQEPSPKPPAPAKPNAVPFWDQGRVQVEVLDMKKDTPATTPQPLSMGTITSNGSAAPSQPTGITGSSGGSSSPVVAVLMKQANNELSVGKADRAATTLERALRIAPDDANLWLRLAEVNEQLGNKQQAASMARKALGLAPDDAALRLRAQRLVN